MNIKTIGLLVLNILLVLATIRIATQNNLKELQIDDLNKKVEHIKDRTSYYQKCVLTNIINNGRNTNQTHRSNKYTLIFRFSELNCHTCINSLINIINLSFPCNIKH